VRTKRKIYCLQGYLTACLCRNLSWLCGSRIQWLGGVNVGLLSSKTNQLWFKRYIGYLSCIEATLSDVQALSHYGKSIRAHVRRIFLSDSVKCSDRALPGTLIMSVPSHNEDVCEFGARIVCMAAMLEAAKKHIQPIDDYALEQREQFVRDWSAGAIGVGSER